jgi:hypothetical protein
MDMCSFLLFGIVCLSCIDVTQVTISFGQHIWPKDGAQACLCEKGKKTNIKSYAFHINLSVSLWPTSPRNGYTCAIQVLLITIRKQMFDLSFQDE